MAPKKSGSAKKIQNPFVPSANIQAASDKRYSVDVGFVFLTVAAVPNSFPGQYRLQALMDSYA